MISVPQCMQPSNTQLFTSNGMEGRATTLSISSATNAQNVLLYRSPSVPL